MIPLGRETTFTCINRATTGDVQFQWLVNGTLVEDLNIGDRIMTDSNNVFGEIYFMNIPLDYNDTTIECRINNITGDIIATLLVQGEECGNFLVANTIDQQHYSWCIWSS